MSMLAERKVKQRWSLNPRGKAWSEDSSKFGQKMLEKMGWSKGKGLGARENGVVEHVKVSYKNDSKGMGYKESNNQWTEHDTNFTALLESLSGEKIKSTEIQLSSLEKKSQTSKVRVHYKKFTRGKDLSRCSEKDLACIFGKRSLKEVPKTEEIDDKIEETNDKFSHSGSMIDYFRKKLPNYVGSNGVLKKESDSEDEARVGFGFPSEKRKSGGEIGGTPKKIKKEEKDEVNGLSNPAFDPLFGQVEVKKHFLNPIQEESEQVKTKSIEDLDLSSGSKKKKKKKSDDSLTLDESNFEDNDVKSGSLSNSGHSQKKKKKKKSVASLSLDNPNFCEVDGEEKEDTHISNTFEVQRPKSKPEGCVFDSSSSQKRKKKKKIDDSLALDNPNFTEVDGEENEDVCINNTFEVQRPKSKSENSDFDIGHCQKKKKKKKPDVSLALDNPNFTEAGCEENEDGCINNTLEVQRPKSEDSNLDNSHGQKKKKKKKCEYSGAVDNPNFDENFEDSHANDTFEVKRKRKKQKKILAIDNPSFDIIPDNVEVKQNNFEVKRKKKNGLALDNPNFDNSSDCQSSYTDSNFEVKRKKKKNDVGLHNPNFVESSQLDKKNEEEPSFDLILNVTSTPSLQKATPKKQSSLKRRKSVRFSNVNEERIIPNNEDVENRNELFDINSKVIADSLNGSSNLDLEEISKKIDGFQAEVENDINEAKATKFIGEVGNPDGENEKLPEGTRLKFKYAKFHRSPSYLFKNASRAKSSIKHLIKGDIILGFKDTNLHEIVGYGVKMIDK